MNLQFDYGGFGIFQEEESQIAEDDIAVDQLDEEEGQEGQDEVVSEGEEGTGEKEGEGVENEEEEISG